MNPNKAVKNKITFRQKDEDDDVIVENVWATKLGENAFRLENIPFEVYLYAFEDVVITRQSHGELMVEKLHEASGNSTFRIMFEDVESLQKIKASLLEKKCDSESDSKRLLLAVCVPQEVAFKEIQKYLQGLEDRGILEFEEACISEAHRTQMEKK